MFIFKLHNKNKKKHTQFSKNEKTDYVYNKGQITNYLKKTSNQ